MPVKERETSPQDTSFSNDSFTYAFELMGFLGAPVEHRVPLINALANALGGDYKNVASYLELKVRMREEM